jgi:RHS repeat-associated protein
MDLYGVKKVFSVLIAFCLSFFVLTTLQGGDQNSLLIGLTGQIVDEIEGLREETKQTDLSHIKISYLDAKLHIANLKLKKGARYLQQEQTKKATKYFKKSKKYILNYIRLLELSYPKKHHYHDRGDSQWRVLLADRAKEIVKHINQLLRGDYGNSTPVANAGPDQSVEGGQVVTLDGSHSADADGDKLSYSWAIISQPSLSDVVVNDLFTATPSFLPIEPGEYVLELIVSDAVNDSYPDTVVITVSSSNTPPTANAGLDQTAAIGDTVTLDGSASSDADGDSLSFSWSLITVPDGSNSELSEATVVRPTFNPDLAGLYQVSLMVSDGQSESIEDVVEIQVDSLNTKPVAIGGPDQSVDLYQLVELDGSASYDVDGDRLSWMWSLISVPQGSLAQLENEQSVNPSFTPDSVGQYIVQLIVDDDQESSEADSVIINVLSQNTIPVANAGVDRSEYVGNLITLDGSESTDADGDFLTYAWSLTSAPDGSNAVLDDPNLVSPSFYIDIAGDYVAQLTVNDGMANSATDEVIVSTVNSRPVANVGGDISTTIGETIRLDGSRSSDADNDRLSYIWSVTDSPSESVALLSDATIAIPTFTPDQIGVYLFQLIVNDGSLDSIPDTLRLQVDPQDSIAILMDEPTDDFYTNQTSISFIGRLNHLAELTINGQAVSLGSEFEFNHPVDLQEGINRVTLQARDALDEEATIIRNVTLDTAVPNIPDIALVDVSDPDNGIVTISGSAGSVEPFAQVVITNLQTGETTTVTADENGAFISQINGSSGDTYSLTAGDAAGNQSDSAQTGGGSGDLPPDPRQVAPELNPTESTPFADTISFLYSGANPIQRGVARDTIEAKRSAVIRGQVRDKQNNPLSGVTITIKDHTEYGQTITRTDGLFDMAVNGGDQLVINYEKSGYLPAQRYIKTGWRDYYRADEVVLIQLDDQVTTIDLTSAEPMQVAQGSMVTDRDGSRQATIMIPQGTTASMTLPNGTMQPLTSLDLRATEYTVGENGPQSMPGSLPPTSGYTYAVELSVDAAVEANASSVNFNQPVQFYVDNFLDFPVGEIVPVGYFDREKSAWIPSQNGKIIKIVSIDAGLAQISLTSTDSIATRAELDTLGISVAEQQQLAETYDAGTELWRVQVEHLTPWDCNWPYGPPDDAEAPNGGVPEVPEDVDNPCEHSGCVIEAENQVLGERIDIVGTPYALHYRSNHVPGSKSRSSIVIPLSGDSLPASLRAIDLTIKIAGRVITQRYPATTNQTVSWIWDGMDVFGREVNGSTTANITVDYIYPSVYYAASADFVASFALAGGSDADNTLRILNQRDTQEINVSKFWNVEVSARNPIMSQANLGHWGFSQHHAYDLNSKTLVMGDGTERDTEVFQNGILSTIVGNGVTGFSGDGGLATEASIRQPLEMDVTPDGSLYFVDAGNNRVRKVDPAGIITTVAGNGSASFFGDGGLATDAQLSNPHGLEVVGDVIYIADTYNHCIRKVDEDGIITTVAGTGGVGGSGGDGGPATEAGLYRPTSLEIASDGTIYFVDSGNARIRKIDPYGIITTVAGNGTPSSYVVDFPNGILATEVSISTAFDLALAPDGSLIFSDLENHRVHRVGTDGILTTVAGNGDANSHFQGIPEGVSAVEDGIRNPWGVAYSPNDSGFYFSYSVGIIRKVDTRGLITTIAGRYRSTRDYADNVSAGDAAFATPSHLVFNNEGELYIADSGLTYGHEYGARIRTITSTWPSFANDDFTIPSKDGRSIYMFDRTGRHLATLDALSGEALYSFGYSSAGYLETVTDAFGAVTRIQRDTSGMPIQIVAPDGQVTVLRLDGNGYLASVVNPSGEQYQMAYDNGGLMTSYTTPSNHVSNYQYDGAARLINDTNPENGGWNLSRTTSSSSFDVQVTSAEGRVTQYNIEKLPSNDQLRTATSPAGITTTRLSTASGEKVVTYPDGTVHTYGMGLDPRVTMNLPLLTDTRIETPSGLISTISRDRSADIADMANLLSLEVLRDTITTNGRTSTREYNASSNTWTYTSAEGRTAQTEINGKGQPVLEQVTDLGQISYSYDNRGRLESQTEGVGLDARTTEFDYYPTGAMAGFLQSVTDAENQVTTFTYDAAGRMTRQTLHDGREVNFGYDENGNLVSLVPPGGSAHHFQYNGVDQAVQYTPPTVSGVSTPQTLYTFDLDKNLTEVQHPDGQRIRYGYGATSGLLDSVTLPRGSYYYSYNATTGNLDSITSPDGGTLSYSYDGFLTTGSHWSGSVTGRVAQSYDNDFRITSRTVNGSDLINYQYDGDSLLVQAGSLEISREAQKAGLINGTTLEGVTTTLRYNGFGEASGVDAHFNTDNLFSATYTRDKLGRITQKVENVLGGSITSSYSYDQAGRLSSETIDSVRTTYTYDADGNRTHVNGVEVASYDDQDRLTAYGSATYQYNDNGELLSKTESSLTTQYSYDALGNLMQVRLPGGMTVDYVVDGKNRRLGKRVDGILVQGFLYRDQLNPIVELDGDNNVVSRFVYGTKDNVPDYMVKEGVTYRIISDHLGSPRLVVNVTSGDVVQRIDYDSWGNVIQDTNPGFQPFGFAGGVYDQHTGLVRYGARDYDPVTGRWTAKDPIRFDGGQFNLYTYVFSDPINGIDPLGLFCMDEENPFNQAQENFESISDLLIGPINDSIKTIGEGLNSLVRKQ